MSQPPDPFEFLKNLWGPMGLPPAGMFPTLIPDEVERRIAELKSVENWLNMNLNVLRMTIQGLEMQRAGLAAMEGATGSAKKAADPVGPAGGPPAATTEDTRSKVQPQGGREGLPKK
ncbi:MAG TPA: PhaM family polyhydroxyalkanoate granule multifunctional regulatory protein [Burkholderiales bacterium]|nr:PhaM family polyhydroxyalkanoate granule multifunctional regulatory protein [Burkholderiales bacterium]